MTFAVSIQRIRYVGMADCEGCVLDPDSTREECRAHVRQTGHVVRFLVEDNTKYAPATEEADRWAG